MGFDYVALTCVALLVDWLILIRILIYGSKYRESRFIQLIGVTILFGIVDSFWGLSYENVFGLGTIGLEIASALYFGMSAIVSYVWFIYMVGLMNPPKVKLSFGIVISFPAFFVVGMCLTNHWTQALYVIGETCDTYHRGPLYVAEQFCTYGYFVVMFVRALAGAILSRNDKKRKKCIIISIFSFVPLVVGFLQIFTAVLPYSSLAYAVSIVTIYLFISVDRNEIILTKESARQNSQLKDALVSTAWSYYEVNVTQNRINGFVYQTCDGDEKIILQNLGLKKDCNYSEYIQKWCSNIDESYQENFNDAFNVENIKQAFEFGKRNITIEYACKDIFDEIYYVRHAMFLSKDEVNDDIIGLVYVTDLTKTIQQQKELDEYIKKQKEFRYLESLSKIYLTLHLIDLKENTVEEVNSISYVREYVNRKTDASSQMEDVMRHLAVKECVEDVLAFTNLATLSERMKGCKVISQEFLGIYTGWFRAQFVAISYDENDNLKEVFFTTQIIDDEKRREAALLEVSYTDELTRLYNRHAYEEDLIAHEKEGIADNMMYVAMDLNGLKIVNDTLGHAAGDEYICGAAKCMIASLGNFGKIYRIGGDEFVAILFDTSDKDLIYDLQKRTEEWTGKLVKRLSFSYGVVNRTEFPCASMVEIAKIADDRMYKNKSEFYKKAGIDRRRR